MKARHIKRLRKVVSKFEVFTVIPQRLVWRVLTFDGDKNKPLQLQGKETIYGRLRNQAV